jgi:SSS family transporter
MVCSIATAGDSLQWKQLPALPDSLGVAGPFAGVSNGALLVAGGANFPNGMPWDGGKKIWHDAVYVLDKPDGAWRNAGKLPRPLAYGISLTTPRGVLCVGGSDAERHYSDVFVLSWKDGGLLVEPLPPLPIPLATAAGAMLGQTVYVACGAEQPGEQAATNRVFALACGDLSPLSAPMWREIEPLPGPARILPVAAAQDGSFFIVGGCALEAKDGKVSRSYLRDAWRYTPGNGWRRVADLPNPVAAAPSPAPATGQSHFLVISGDDASLLAIPPAQRSGFPARVVAYHTITNTWTPLGETPAPRVTAPAVPWAGGFVIPSGEMRPGVRSPEVWRVAAVSRKDAFGWLNYGALLLYPVIMVGISIRVGQKATTDEYFRGGQRIPWWAAGLSIFATVLSSITYMAIPAKAFATDWAFTLANLTIILLAPVVVFIFLPFFRQLDVTTAYEYLEKRFNAAARWFGSASFILLQFGRTAIVLYLPALALATVSEFPIEWCLVMMGAITLAMTFMGGVESVIWTDVAQSAILLAGAIVTLVIVAAAVPGGFGGIWNIAMSDGKLYQDLSWSWDMTLATGSVILVGNLLSTLITYVGSQDVVQRYQSTGTQQGAARAIWTNAFMTIPGTVLFFGVGTALYAFYKCRPDRLDVQLTTDAIFPLFMVREMPAGLGGLAVAGVFAAAQPTSSLNSIATAFVTDFYARWRPDAADARKLRVARWVTMLSGIGGTAAAVAMTRYNIQSLWDAFLALLGLTGGALAGLFCLGIVSTRANGRGAMVGALGSIATLWFVRQYTQLHFFTYGGIGILTCMALGWVASLLLPERPRDLTGLTLFTKTSAPADALLEARGTP